MTLVRFAFKNIKNNRENHEDFEKLKNYPLTVKEFMLKVRENT